MLDFLSQELEALKSNGLHRSLRTIERIDGSHIWIDGREYINFCPNDYLGLSQHPKVKEAAAAAIKEFGAGAGASRLITGNTVLHEALERKLAKFKGREAAIVFSTGYQVNLGVISSLVDEHDTIIIDRLNHASIIDACRLSKAKIQVYPHKDMKKLAAILKKSAKFRRRLIVTDAVFSMDGDIAPLPEIIKLAEEFEAITMIDEAHSTGVLGARGQGIEEHFDLHGKVNVIMGTLSKALGSLGGFVAGSSELIDFLRNKARSFIYTTALPASACAAAIAALETIEAQPELIEKLRTNSRLLGSELTPIIPIIIGDTEKTMAASKKLLAQGFFVSAIRPPTIPKGESRLRITVSAIHKKEEITCLASLLPALIPA